MKVVQLEVLKAICLHDNVCHEPKCELLMAGHQGYHEGFMKKGQGDGHGKIEMPDNLLKNIGHHHLGLSKKVNRKDSSCQWSRTLLENEFIQVEKWEGLIVEEVLKLL